MACAKHNLRWCVSRTAHAGTDLDLNKASPSFLATALKKTRSMCKQKRSLVFIQTAHAGTDLDLNKVSPSFLATALKKTRSMCKQNRSLVFLQTAHAGTDLD